MKITLRYRTVYPEADVEAAMQGSVMARTRRDYAGQGMRSFLLDVALDAIGTVRGREYSWCRSARGSSPGGAADRSGPRPWMIGGRIQAPNHGAPAPSDAMRARESAP